MDLQIQLNKDETLPLHRQIYQEFRRLILTGVLSPGTRIPSTRELADLLSVSRTTTHFAYEQLLHEGYLQAVAGSGTFVCRELPESLLQTPEELTQVSTPAPGRRDAILSEQGKFFDTRGDYKYEGRLLPGGSVAYDQIPMKHWKRILLQQCENANVTALEYCRDAAGLLPLREAVAAYLSRARAVKCSTDQILIVSGSQQALDLIARLHVDRGDTVVVEDPVYFDAQRTYAAYGAKLQPVPVDENGLDVEALEEIKGAKLIYVTPSHQFPTGTVLPLTRRLQLLDWAARNGTLVIEDDYDSEFRYGGMPVPALQGLDKHGVVLYTGTFSKLLYPSLRIGYLVVPPDLVHVYTWAKRLADQHSTLLEQAALTEFICEGHLETHIRRMRTLYDKRRQTVVTSLRKHFGEGAQVIGANAGLHILVRFHQSIPEEAIQKAADAAGVPFRSTFAHYMARTRPKGEFALCYANIAEDVLIDGISKFARELHALLKAVG